jgi:hypothetical protein
MEIRMAAGCEGRAHPLEVEEQKTCWSWLASVVVGNRSLQEYSYHVPNGTQLGGARVRRAQYMASLKSQGLKPGVSDLVIAYPVGQYHGAYIELKRLRESYKGPAALAASVSKEQQAWLLLMASVGYWASVAYGASEFKEQVRAYLQKKKAIPLAFSL